MDKVTLWTRQDIRSLDDLERKGVIRITRKHLEEKFDVISDHIIFYINGLLRRQRKECQDRRAWSFSSGAPLARSIC